MALKHDPTRPVRAQIDDLEVELRVVGKIKPPLGDFVAEGGAGRASRQRRSCASCVKREPREAAASHQSYEVVARRPSTSITRSRTS